MTDLKSSILGVQTDIAKHTKAINNEIDAMVLHFFGSVERAKELAPLFVIEHKREPEFRLKSENGDSFIYSMEIETRIRMKTPEELEAERNG